MRLWIALNEGAQGHEVIDVKITFLEADYDSVMGTPADFRRLVPMALKKAFDDSNVEMLEPWQSFIISVLVDYDKTVLNDICKIIFNTAFSISKMSIILGSKSE